ncbi:hypothetical protein PG995_004625 [Apiospora arundinis]
MAAGLQADLHTILSILPTEDAKKVWNCYATGKKLRPKEKKQHYRQTFSTLVEEDNKRSLVHACYALVFDIEGYHCGKEFETQEHRKRLASLVTVTRHWGRDIVQHYEFSSQKDYIWTNSGKSQFVTSGRTQWGPVEDPLSLPQDCGKDLYGLIVRKKFAKSSPLPSAQTPDYYDGSTLLPTSPSETCTTTKFNEPISPTPIQRDNSNASTTTTREQITTPSPRSSSLSQSLPVPPATLLVDNGDVAMGDDGRDDTHSTVNGPTASSSAQPTGYNAIHSRRPSISSHHLSPTSHSSLPSDVAASQSSPSSLSITRTSSEADTTTTICSSPPSPSPELSSTSSQRRTSKAASVPQNDDYSDVSISWEERSNPPHCQQLHDNDIVPTFALAAADILDTTIILPPGYRSRISVTVASPAKKAASSLLEGPEDCSSQDGNVHAINPAAIPYPYSAAPPLPSASLVHSRTETLNIDSHPSSPLLVAPSTPKSAWLRDVPSSIHRLDEKGWLNDTIVNGYMHLITEHHDVCFLNSHFLPSMKWRFENGKCPLESEFVLMPINENSHWYLLIMYKRYFPATDHHERVVCFLDSLGASHSSSFNRWKTYLEARGDRLPVQIEEVQVPQQTNTSDCGVFVLGFAETILQNVQGFIEAIDGGKELGWEFDGQTLRDHIRDTLTLAADAEELIGEIAKLQARGSPLADKLETLKYKEFLGGLKLPLLRRKAKTPHDEVAIGIKPSSLSDAKEVTSASCKPDIIAAGRSYETIRNYDLPTVHQSQLAHVAGQVIPTKNIMVERPNSEPPRKRRRQQDNLSRGSFPLAQARTIPHSEQAAALMAAEGKCFVTLIKTSLIYRIAIPHPDSHVRVSKVERDSYILNEAQAKWAAERHVLEIVNIINLETALDCDGSMV